jgi:hypothetical protein
VFDNGWTIFQADHAVGAGRYTQGRKPTDSYDVLTHDLLPTLQRNQKQTSAVSRTDTRAKVLTAFEMVAG